MTVRRAALTVAIVALLVAGLAYLRDPIWILTMSSGLATWETDGSGARFRWMGGHASFFVSSDAHGVELPLRTTFDAAGDWPIVATITIDDRAADRLVLSTPDWQRSLLSLPPPSGRRARRIDIRLDRVRTEDRGVQVGEIRLR